MVLAVAVVVCLIFVATVAAEPIFGEDAAPLLHHLETDAGVQLAPPGLTRTSSNSRVDSGLVVVTKSFDADEPTAVFRYYATALPQHGWQHDDTGVFKAGERWIKEIKGRTASYDVISRPDQGSVEISVYLRYETGLLRG